MFGWLQGVYGAELSGTNADKRRLIRHALDEEHLEARATWMVGDSMREVGRIITREGKP